MVITHKLRPMYLTCKNVTQRVDVMQDDKYSRCLEIPLRANGDDVELPEDVRAVIRYQKPDGTGGNYDTLPDGTSAYTVSGNVITVALAPQVCTVPGVVQMVVCLMHGNAEINTFAVLVNVHRNPGIDAESQDYTNMRSYVKSYGWPPDKTLRTDSDGNVVADDEPGGELDPEAVQQIVEDYLAANPPTVTETDPTVPKWAKQPTKPRYTAAEVGALPDTYTPPNQTAEQVGADPAGAAASAVSQHNTDATAHNDLRLALQGLSDRINAALDSDDATLDQMSEVVAYIKSNKILIDAITTSKVSVADIVNDLATNMTDKPLSAAQGVVIKTLIDALRNDKLDAAELVNAVNTALAQAKSSGEFDGEDGKTAYQYAVDGGYTGTEVEFAKKLASEAMIVWITESNGTLSADKTFTEIRDAILAGTTVLAGYDDIALPLIALAADFTWFGTIACANDEEGALVATVIIEITQYGEVNDISAQIDIPKTLPNPNALTFTGAVSGSYDGSAPLRVKIPSAVTDDHINELINTALNAIGVAEEGAY